MKEKRYHILCDIFANDTATSNLNLNGFVENATSKCLHLSREGSREHDSLSIRPDIVDDFHYLLSYETNFIHFFKT